MRFALKEAILQERSVCRHCTQQLVDELEEERGHLKHDVQVLEQDVTTLQKQAEEESEGYLDVGSRGCGAQDIFLGMGLENSLRTGIPLQVVNEKGRSGENT